MKVKSTFFDSEFPPPQKKWFSKKWYPLKMLGIPPKTAILVVLFLARFGTGHSQGFHPRGTPSFRGGLDLGVVPKDGDVFVVCLFCSLLCFGVFSFFLDDEFNESSRKTRFLFQKKHMSSTWALSVWATKGRRHSRWEPWVSSLDCFGLSSFESLIWSLPSLERNVDCCDAWEL